MHLRNRVANVPRAAIILAEKVSKQDLLEAAWHLASLCNDAESADDDSSTFARLLAELRLIPNVRIPKRTLETATQALT